MKDELMELADKIKNNEKEVINCSFLEGKVIQIIYDKNYTYEQVRLNLLPIISGIDHDTLHIINNMSEIEISQMKKRARINSLKRELKQFEREIDIS